jgi:hypothetical protein
MTNKQANISFSPGGRRKCPDDFFMVPAAAGNVPEIFSRFRRPPETSRRLFQGSGDFFKVPAAAGNVPTTLIYPVKSGDKTSKIFVR